MAEPARCDVWLCRLDGDENAKLLTVGRIFRVDVRAARHILAQLPRQVARDLAGADARRLAAKLREAGALVHVCGAGERPDFASVSSDAAAPREPAAVQRRVRADDAAVEAARAADDAAVANWPDPGEEEPYVWEAEGAGPPPAVPAPMRHSAQRVAWALIAILCVLGASGAAYWQRYGKDLVAVAIAKPAMHVRASAAQPRAPADAGVDDGGATVDDEAPHPERSAAQTP